MSSFRRSLHLSLRLNGLATCVACLLAFVPGIQAAAWQIPQLSLAAKPDDLVRSGVAAERAGDYRSAIEDFRKALTIKPGMEEAHADLGGVLAETGQLDPAIEEYGRALALAPNKAEVRMNLGMAYYKKGDLTEAREQLERVHAEAPANISGAVLLGDIYVKLGKMAEAVSLLTPLERGHENNMNLEYILAFCQIESGKEKEGVPRMERVARATHRADAYVVAGALLLHRGEMSGARVDLDEAMRLDPSIPGLPTMAGQARYALNDMPAAAAAFQAALRANARDFNANLDLGAIRLKEHDYENARPLLELALELQPKVPIARLEMAKLDEAANRYSEAAIALEALVKDEPNWMDAHWELANAYFELNRPEDGKHERMIAQQLRAQPHDEARGNQ